jgi:hypothetical protein
MNAQDGRAMYELQLELHTLATGRRPLITADDLLEVHELLTAHEGDLKSLFAGTAQLELGNSSESNGVPR